ncbi:MAG: ABC transporter substrate-binding protein, partial [Campylobacterota bacterium]|nr:ABC transporter substrate-binding protein [Campylobacterota bacterium]
MISFSYYTKKVIAIWLFASFLLFSNLLANDSLQKIKLQLQWKHQFEFAGFYAAKTQGFYKEVGLDVEFIEYDNTQSIVDTVLNKKAHFGLTYSSLIAEFLKGKEVVFVANYFKQSPLVIVTQPSIKTPAMLKGKRVMGVSDNIDNITLKLMLEKFGISLDQIKNIPTSYSVNEFANKAVDAMALFTTNEIYQLDQLGVKYNLFNPSLYGHEYYDVNLFTTKEYALNNPEVIEKFKEASNRGWKYALAHKDEMVNLILKEYNTQNKTKEALLFEAHQIEQLMFTKTQKIGYIDPLRVQFIAQNFIESGYVDASRLDALDHLLYNHPKRIIQHDNTLRLTKKEREFIVKHPKIILGTGDSWEPYSIKRPDGKIVGFDQDILNLVNKKTGANFVLQHGDWTTMQELARKRQIDGLATLTMTKERKEFLNFSDKYTFLLKNVYVKQGNPKNIRSLRDLEGKTISVHKGNIADEKFAKSVKNAKIIYSSTQLDMLKEVIYGEADATSGNGATEYMMAKLGLPYMKNAFALDYLQSLHFAIRDDWPEAITIFNKGLRSISQEQRIALHSKWFAQVNHFIRNQLKLSNKEQNYLNSKEYITMCVDPDWEPYEYIDSQGKHRGLAANFI